MAITYTAGLSASGLLVEIDVLDGGVLIGYVQIGRAAWPDLVKSVEASMLENLVDAQINVVLGGASEEAED